MAKDSRDPFGSAEWDPFGSGEWDPFGSGEWDPFGSGEWDPWFWRVGPQRFWIAPNYHMQQSFYPVPAMQLPQFAPMGFISSRRSTVCEECSAASSRECGVFFSPIQLSGNDRLRQMMDLEGYVPLIIVQSLSRSRKSL
uniref:Uncharacterized protein n=1 Tax=Ditylenchus dipsaci TaxID=166011 RepID=A0A915CWQ0_9BILA